MSHQRHEIPTHLNVEDKSFWGLSARRFMYLAAGLAGAYTLWNQWPELPLAARAAVAAACLLLAAALALVQPQGRGLEEWLFVLLHYLAVPKVSVWRPVGQKNGPDPAAETSWVELEPEVAWSSRRTEEQQR